LPPALAGGNKIEIVLNGFSQNGLLFWLKPNLTLIYLSPAKAGGNSKSAMG
jgi:hypothetical protein